jgi:mRNA-degrading endonuclease RelE of RelBE toxin-antitoxin system
MERWQQEGLHCHIADGPDADRVDFRCLVEDEMGRYNDLTFAYLDDCKPTHPYHFVQCAHCQAVRSSQFAIYRITPQTGAETYIAIGMSIALSTQFGYEIPKIFLTADVRDVPSLLSGYEVIEAVSTKVRKQRLRKALPVVMQRVQECAWRPRVLPFEVQVPLGSVVAHDETVEKTAQEVEREEELISMFRENDVNSDWNVAEKPSFTSELNALPAKEMRRVMAKFQELVQDPKPDGKVKKQLKHTDPPLYRIRCGEYRIFYTFTYPFISLLALRQRDDDTYKDLPESYYGLQLEPSRRRVWIDGSLSSESLTEEEFKLLQFLAEHAGEVCSREKTVRAVYDEPYFPTLDDHGLDALIERARQKIEDDPRSPRFIETVRGVGHRLNGYIGERS